MKKRTKFFGVGAVVLLILMAFMPMVLTIDTPPAFTLPEWGGAMVHSDPHQTDYIECLDVPKNQVGIVWENEETLGEKSGTIGVGVAGNREIAACTFHRFVPKQGEPLDNLGIYEYDGSLRWKSDNILWASATFSTPMVDIYNRVIACDHIKILMIDLDDIMDGNHPDYPEKNIQWLTEFGNIVPFCTGIPFSPTITENGIIVLPTWGGPIFTFDSLTGEPLHHIYLDNGVIIDPYYGIPEMPIADYEAVFCQQTPTDLPNPSVEIPEESYRRTYEAVFCQQTDNPFKLNIENNTIEWTSSTPYGALPFNTVTVEDNTTLFVAPRGRSVVKAYDAISGELLACSDLLKEELISGPGWYATMNSACVNGNRVYVLAECMILGYLPTGDSRLYAIDVGSEGELDVAWYFEISDRSSQATPTFIDGTLYFDSYLPGGEDPRIYAITDYGDSGEPQSGWPDGGYVEPDNMTWFSFSSDPRGGFWYIDSNPSPFQPSGRKLIHFNTVDGTFMEEIVIDDLMADEKEYTPMSVMQICESQKDDLIMIVSANWHSPNYRFVENYVIAIDLTDNSLLWKVLIESDDYDWLNHASGQYTILMDEEDANPLVVFCKWLGGIMAIGVVE